VALLIDVLATAELADAAEWYETRRSGLGVALVEEFDRAFSSIEATPLAWARWLDTDPALDALEIRRFPPGYWLKRTPR